MSQAISLQRTFQIGIQAVLPALCTLAIFVALGLANLFHKIDAPALLYTIDSTPLPPTPPPPPRKETTQPVQRDIPKPKLAVPKPVMALQASLSLDQALSNVGGDFALTFDVLDPTLQTRPEDLFFDIVDVDTPPQARLQPDPIYPTRARLQKLEGEVQCEFIVDPQGVVRNLRIVSSRPVDVFDEAVLRALRRWRFQPGIRNGEAVSVRVYQTLTFTLDP